LKRLPRLLLVLGLVAALGGCVSGWCWCDDPEASPRNPGQDGRSST